MTKARDLANASTALSAVSATELGYVDGVTSAIQTQMDAKLATATATSTYIPKTLTSTTGDIIYASAANTPARLGIGSTSQVLTVSGGAPSWATPASGGMTLLSTTTLSGASTTISSINQTYQHLYMIVYGVTNATADGQTLVRANSLTSAYYGTNIRNTTLGVTSGGGITFEQGTRTSATNINMLTFYDYADTFVSDRHLVFGIGYTPANTNFQTWGGIATASAISSFEFVNTGGNFTAGTVEIWGIK